MIIIAHSPFWVSEMTKWCLLSEPVSTNMFVFVPLCRCNGEVELGSKALDDVLYRAQLELFPEALLVGAVMFFCYYHISHYCVVFLDLWGVCVCVCLSIWESMWFRYTCWPVVLIHACHTMLYCVGLCMCVCQRLQAECNPTRLFTCFPLCSVKL